MTNHLLQARLDFYLELRRSLGFKTYWSERVLRTRRARSAPKPPWTGHGRPRPDATAPVLRSVFACSGAFLLT